MKAIHILAATLLIMCNFQASAEEHEPVSMCTSITYRAFGEPMQSAFNCFNKTSIGYLIRVNIDNYQLPPMAVSLDIPGWRQSSIDKQKKTFIGLVTKENGQYIVKVQITLDDKQTIASVPVELDQTKEVQAGNSLLKITLTQQTL